MTARTSYLSLFHVVMISTAFAQPEGFNYDESKVPAFTLPDPLRLANGAQVTDAAVWKTSQRAEIVNLLETYVYGRAPADGRGVRFGDVQIDRQALGGSAIRKQVKVFFSGATEGPTADLLIYLPAHAKAPAPIFVGLNFGGNHTVTDDTEIWISTSWMPSRDDAAVVDHRATHEGRGKSSSRWPIQEIVARGYGVATIYSP